MMVDWITTTDKPFDPIDQFDEWYQYDEEKGYHTCSYLGRVARTSDQLSDQENYDEIKRAIDQIIKNNFMNMYLRVEKDMPDSEVLSTT